MPTAVKSEARFHLNIKISIRTKFNKKSEDIKEKDVYNDTRRCRREANASIMSLKSSLSVSSLSTLNNNSADRRVSPIVDLSVVFVSFSLENERSAEAVVTGSVRHSL